MASGALLAQHDVAGLEVPVDDAFRMGLGESGAGALEDVDHPGRRHGAVGGDDPAQVHPGRDRAHGHRGDQEHLILHHHVDEVAVGVGLTGIGEGAAVPELDGQDAQGCREREQGGPQRRAGHQDGAGQQEQAQEGHDDREAREREVVEDGVEHQARDDQRLQQQPVHHGQHSAR